MAMDGKTLGEAGMALDSMAEDFVLGSTSAEQNDTREKVTSRPLVPYVALALGITLLGAGLWVMALIAFAAYIILTATSFEKSLKPNILLPSELASTSLDDKPGYKARF
jgi:hypothetical protein